MYIYIYIYIYICHPIPKLRNLPKQRFTTEENRLFGAHANLHKKRIQSHQFGSCDTNTTKKESSFCPVAIVGCLFLQKPLFGWVFKRTKEAEAELGVRIPQKNGHVSALLSAEGKGPCLSKHKPVFLDPQKLRWRSKNSFVGTGLVDVARGATVFNF